MNVTIKSVTGLGVLCAVFSALYAAVGAGAPPAPAGAPAPAAATHRVVFQVSADGDEPWDALIGNVENLRAAFAPEHTTVRVVAHGKGLGLVMATNAVLRERMQKLHDGGVMFVACENTMRKKKVTKEQLLPFVTTVDSGVAEVVRKQELGWTYIKSGG